MRKQPEALARLRIDNSLQQLGWILDVKGKETNTNVRLEGDLKLKEDKKKLGKLRPDYVLYANDSDIPIGIIEAKKPKHKRMSEALDQAKKYAKKLNYPNMIIFASDGNITLAAHVSKGELSINGETVNDFVTQEWAVELSKNPALDSGEKLKNVDELIVIFDKVSDRLRKEGIESGLDSLREFCVILFIKIMSEKKKALPECDWDELSNSSGDTLMRKYKRIVKEYQNYYGEIFSGVKIKKSNTLEFIINEISPINFSDTNLDVKGGAYEYFLSKYNHSGKRGKSVLGQYFTPRHITKMMSQLLKLEKDKTIYDPFCGTGGMLVSCYDAIVNLIDEDDKRSLKKLKQKTMYGRDITESASRLAKMNMIVIGDGHSNICWEDSISNPVFKRYDVVITNIPFNIDSFDLDLAKCYKAESGDANELAVRHCLNSLKRGGKAAIIVPETIAYAEEYFNLRNFLINNTTINAIIRLPNATFKGYTSARTFILLLENVWTQNTNSFTYINLESDGYSDDARREPIPDNDIADLLDVADNLEENYKQIEISEKGGGVIINYSVN